MKIDITQLPEDANRTLSIAQATLTEGRSVIAAWRCSAVKSWLPIRLRDENAALRAGGFTTAASNS
ncbi:hypothetical protein KCP76_14670 [Salmonella enterica subsp. enterica serovar Weltevreden]|nr:hypothetical protein KCP76_14670 [Salmonella enterica subsp. enterica serovar Weltevreden]